MSGLPKVLVVEDDPNLQKMFARELRGKATVLAAHTVEEARKMAAENPDVLVIAVDGCLHRGPAADVPETLSLIVELRRAFSGPMIAIAGLPCHQEKMLGAGCDRRLCDKALLPFVIGRLIKDLQEGRAK